MAHRAAAGGRTGASSSRKPTSQLLHGVRSRESSAHSRSVSKRHGPPHPRGVRKHIASARRIRLTSSMRDERLSRSRSGGRSSPTWSTRCSARSTSRASAVDWTTGDSWPRRRVIVCRRAQRLTPNDGAASALGGRASGRDAARAERKAKAHARATISQARTLFPSCRAAYHAGTGRGPLQIGQTQPHFQAAQKHATSRGLGVPRRSADSERWVEPTCAAGRDRSRAARMIAQRAGPDVRVCCRRRPAAAVIRSCQKQNHPWTMSVK